MASQGSGTTERPEGPIRVRPEDPFTGPSVWLPLRYLIAGQALLPPGGGPLPSSVSSVLLSVREDRITEQLGEDIFTELTQTRFRYLTRLGQVIHSPSCFGPWQGYPMFSITEPRVREGFHGEKI